MYSKDYLEIMGDLIEEVMEEVEMELDLEEEEEYFPSDEDIDEMFDLEMGFDPYEGCYSWDC